MSTLIRPSFVRASFHALTLSMLACACLWVMQTVNTVVSVSLLPPPASVFPSGEHSAAPPVPSVPLSVERLARQMGLPLAERAKPSPAIPEDMPPTQLGLKLLGTMTSAVGDLSLASIHEDATRRTRTVWVGSSLLGAEVFAIERTRVLLWNNGRMEILDLRAPLAAPALAAAPPPSAGPPTGFGSTVRPTGLDSYTIQRQDVENTLANMAQVATQVRVVPAFQGEVAVGFKLLGMKQDSLFTRLGLKNGDTLRRINGFSLESPTLALEAYNHLKNSSRIELELERDGQVLGKTYTVE